MQKSLLIKLLTILYFFIINVFIYINIHTYYLSVLNLEVKSVNEMVIVGDDDHSDIP